MQQLKNIRKNLGLTQAQVQEKTGICRTMLSKYENGKAEPTVEVLILLADFYCTSTDYLLGRTNNPAPL